MAKAKTVPQSHKTNRRVARTDEELIKPNNFDEAHIVVNGVKRRFLPIRDGFTKIMWNWYILPISEDRKDADVPNSIVMELIWNQNFGWSAYFVCEQETAKGVMHMRPKWSGCASSSEAISNAIKSFQLSINRWLSVQNRVYGGGSG